MLSARAFSIAAAPSIEQVAQRLKQRWRSSTGLSTQLQSSGAERHFWSRGSSSGRRIAATPASSTSNYRRGAGAGSISAIIAGSSPG